MARPFFPVLPLARPAGRSPRPGVAWLCAAVMSRSAPSTRRLALLLAGLSMFGPFSIDTIFPAFRVLGRAFAAEPAAVQQTVSVYLLAYAGMSLAHGALSDALGRRRVILGSLVVFALASVGCALSPNLATLLVFRALQGGCAGAGMIVGRAVIRDLFQGHQAQRLMSQVSMIFGIAPAIAPIVGGWILGVGLGWPMIFWCLVGFAVLLLGASAAWLPETHPAERRTPIAPRRLLGDYLHIGLDPHFLRLAAAAAFNFAAIFLYIASAPVVVMDMLGKSEQGFAWLFLPTIGGMTLGAFVSGRMAGHVQARRQVGIGFACCLLAAVFNLAYSFSVAHIQVPWALLPVFLGGAGMGMVYPVLSLAVLDMFPQHRGLASSVQAFLQLTTNALVAGVVSPLLSASPRWLALGFAGCFALGGVCWCWERRVQRRLQARDAA